MSQAIFSVFILCFFLTSIFRPSSFIMCLIFLKCISITNVYQNDYLLKRLIYVWRYLSTILMIKFKHFRHHVCYTVIAAKKRAEKNAISYTCPKPHSL